MEKNHFYLVNNFSDEKVFIAYDKQINVQLLDIYSKLMVEYQVNVQINNNFYEKDYVGNKLENNGKKTLII